MRKRMQTPLTRRKLKLARERRARERRRSILVGLAVLAACLWFVVSTLSAQSSLSNVEGGGLVRPPPPPWRRGAGGRGGGLRRAWMPPDAAPFNDHKVAQKAEHLIMVAGHSVIIGGDLEHAGTDESMWYLLDYQKHKGLPQAIVSHIRAGIDAARSDPRSLLVFSGGETRSKTGPVNEGGSYFRVADAMDLWGEDESNGRGNDDGEGEGARIGSAGGLRPGSAAGEAEGRASPSTVRSRTVTEEYATDSFQNLMFSICRFKEVTGNYPTRITVVSFSYKQKRFEGLHAPALQWPDDRFAYVGVDPPSSTGFNLAEALEGELKNAAHPFESDPYGCSTPVLQKKRKERNPFSRTPPYELTCPEMKSLFRWCGPSLIPKDQLPWGDLR